VRQKNGKTFSYHRNGKKISDKEEIKRIGSLVLPPAWEDVWICALQNGHLQATGMDVKRRKQYRYHPSWNSLRNHTKFYRLLEFGKGLPAMRLQLEQDLSKSGFPQEKVLAAIVMLMERTNIRVGSNIYEKLYGSFGLTTLKDKHVEVRGTAIRFSFKGKKGVQHDISLKNKKLASIVQKSKDITGKELFQYVDDAGVVHDIDSGMVNDYIHTISNADFTAKDFRTWAGSVHAITGFKEIGEYVNATDMRKKIPAMYAHVAKQLGNTATVCKKYYVHPMVVSMYEQGKLSRYIKRMDAKETGDDGSGLTSEEKALMSILKSK
jgi:DNA topoisomerase-1